MHQWQIPCLTGGDGGLGGGRGGKWGVGGEGEIINRQFFNFLNIMNYPLFTFPFIILIWDLYGISSV